MNIGRRIYYVLSTGAVIVDTCDKSGNVRAMTVDEEIAAYRALSERNRNTFDYIELNFGQFAQIFPQVIGYRVDPQTKTLVFTYPVPEETSTI